jgi:hypothetical protein
MQRIISEFLIKWSVDSRRKPLLLRGARQVGKTWLVEQLANDSFKSYLKIDFEENPNFIQIFNGDLDPNKICAELEIRTGTDIIDSKTLLFFDEVQACPRAILSLRYFYEKRPDLHIIAAGSLLEFAFDEISFPVGRIQTMEVHPMNFIEFLIALGFYKAAKACELVDLSISESTHLFLMEQLRNYFLVGGMPECVKTYSETKSLKSAIDIQNEIIESYILDFNKYKPKTDINCLNNVFYSLAAKTGQQIKYTALSQDFTIPTIKKAVFSLSKARLIHKVKSIGIPGIPMNIFASDKKFKSVFLDIGLMNKMMDIDYNEALNHNSLLSIYKGQLAEQFIGQEMISSANSQLYYWSRDAKSSNAEVDYLVSKKNEIYPIEVKDGPAGKLRSLHLYRTQYSPKKSFVFHSGNAGILEDENITFLPLYYAYALSKSEEQ